MLGREIDQVRSFGSVEGQFLYVLGQLEVICDTPTWTAAEQSISIKATRILFAFLDLIQR